MSPSGLVRARSTFKCTIPPKALDSDAIPPSAGTDLPRCPRRFGLYMEYAFLMDRGALAAPHVTQFAIESRRGASANSCFLGAYQRVGGACALPGRPNLVSLQAGPHAASYRHPPARRTPSS